jgi:hypothetical protein
MATDERLERSRGPGGAHAFLASIAGDWEGTTRLWLEPGKLTDTSPSRGRIRLALGGRFAVHEYEGSVAGDPLSGIAIYGCDVVTAEWQMAWADTWHMATCLLWSTGPGAPAPYAVRGWYRDPSGGPPWGWRTELRLEGPDRLVVRMFNVTPEGEEALAVETVYDRRSTG